MDKLPIVTNPVRTDGFGAQLQTIICAAIYAEISGCEFRYTPFRIMEHNYDNDPLFLQKKEEYLGFINHYPINTDDNIQSKINATQFIQFFDKYLKFINNSVALKKMKEVIRIDKSYESVFGDSNITKTNIAVHIRRHNTHDDRIAGTNTPDSVYLSMIEKLRTSYPNPVFHLYSQGDVDGFTKKYHGYDIRYHINETIEDTFNGLIFADVLVMSASSLSYSAALLSNGIVYYLPFWHPPLPDWKII